MVISGCQSEPSVNRAPYDAIKSPAAPTAARGTAATTREFGTFDELLRAVDAVGSCREPRMVRVETIGFYLADGMAPAISTTAICESGRGAVIGQLRPGTAPDFQRAYQRAAAENPALWHSKSHVLMLGNGFFVFPRTTVAPGWELSGLRHLRCDAKQSDVPTYEKPAPADIPGCSLHTKPWRRTG